MTAVIHLTPGDRIPAPLDHGERLATYISQTRHPIWPNLQLVIWRMPDGSLCLDALSPAQDVGTVVPASAEDRARALEAALLGPRGGKG